MRLPDPSGVHSDAAPVQRIVGTRRSPELHHKFVIHSGPVVRALSICNLLFPMSP